MSAPHQKSAAGQALAELNGGVCAACGAKKKGGNSFCRACYFRLPPKLRQSLYRSFYGGYVEAYEDAKDWLRDNQPEDL